MYDARANGAQCDSCPLSGCKVIPPEGNLQARQVFVGEAPGAQEIKLGRPFVGPSGVKLSELLYATGGTQRKDVWITNALLCRAEVPDKEGKKRYDVKEYMAWIRRENVRRKRANKQLASGSVPFPEIRNPFDCCAPRLYAELRWFDQQALTAGAPNGVVVVPMGNFALGMLTAKPGTARGVMKYRGSVLRPGEGQ